MIIKIHSSVAALSIKYNMENQYILWCLAKNLSNGSGKCSFKELCKSYKELFLVSHKTFYNHINYKMGTFYTKNGKNIFIKSLENIIKEFEPITVFNSCIEIDTSYIILHNLNCKQILTSILVASDKRDKPISLFYLSRILNQSRSSIKRNISNKISKIIPNYKNRIRIYNSYQLIGGRFLKSKTEKKYIKQFKCAKNGNIRLKKSNIDHTWEIFGTNL